MVSGMSQFHSLELLLDKLYQAFILQCHDTSKN